MKLKNQGLYLSEFEHDNCGAGLYVVLMVREPIT